MDRNMDTIQDNNKEAWTICFFIRLFVATTGKNSNEFWLDKFTNGNLNEKQIQYKFEKIFEDEDLKQQVFGCVGSKQVGKVDQLKISAKTEEGRHLVSFETTYSQLFHNGKPIALHESDSPGLKEACLKALANKQQVRAKIFHTLKFLRIEACEA
eukprot:m.7829 g.7829  ORF g.7829 m.7829 type:complete len:155 (+) comp3784_c0_seq1:264-728(+)